MKTIIFLIIIALVVAALIWHMKKTQAKAELARQESLKLKRKREKEALTPDEVMIWPVIIRPVSGKNPSGEEADIEEPSMTTIEFKPPGKMAG